MVNPDLKILVTFAACFLNAAVFTHSIWASGSGCVSLDENSINQYFSNLEKRSESIAAIAPDSEYNKYFVQIFKENFVRDTSRFVALPHRIMVYLYDRNLMYPDTEMSMEDFDMIVKSVSPKDTISFVPKVDIGKKVIYLDPEVRNNLLNFLGKPHNRWEGGKVFRNYSEEDEEALDRRVVLLRNYIDVTQPRYGTGWYLLNAPVINYILVGKEALYLKAEFDDRWALGHYIDLKDKDNQIIFEWSSY